MFRYALQLIITAQILAKKRKSTVVEKKDIAEAYGLFVDRYRSQQFIDSHQDSFIFNSGKTLPNSNRRMVDEKMDTC